MDARRVTTLVRNIILLYFIYVIVFGALIFLIKPKAKFIDMDVDRFISDSVGGERVSLVEDRYESYLTRIDLIEGAEDSLDIAYYTLHDGETTRVVLGSILDAADRGVEVRFLLDGMFHNLKKDIKDVIYTFNEHPNIELKFYEDLKPLQPWTFNNRLHDKFIIVDGEKFLLGGRNIGDKYFLENFDEKKQVRDRDIFVYKEDKGKASVVDDLLEYFEKLWNVDYSQNPVKIMNEKKKDKAELMGNVLRERYEKEKKENKDLERELDYKTNTFETNKVSIVSNPINRGNKYPTAFKTLAKLASRAKKIDVQSPYVLPTSMMRHYVEDYDIDFDRVNLYTNSEYASPNPFGMAGYRKYRKRIVDSGVNVYEYQGPGSIHGKSYIFDDRLSVVGSLNIDNRSAFLSTETIVLVDSEDFSKSLLKELDKLEGNSFLVKEDYEYEDIGQEIKEASFVKKLIIRILSVFTYFFDFML